MDANVVLTGTIEYLLLEELDMCRVQREPPLSFDFSL